MIRQAHINDAAALSAIYNYYVQHSVITFAEQAMDEGAMREKIAINKKYPFLVYEADGAVIAYAYIDEFHSRSAYRFTLETSIYVHAQHLGKGIGAKLYTELIQQARQQAVHSLIAIISLPNSASITLHENLSFERVGVIKEAGFKFNAWVDVEYWQLLL